jgi:hypothetical protein
MASTLKIATINTTDQVALLTPRVMYLRPTIIGTAWLEVKFGMIYTYVPLANDDAACGAETVVSATFRDWFAFGLKDGGANPPGQAGGYFLGIIEQGSNALAANSAGAGNRDGTKTVAGYNGATLIGSVSDAARFDFAIYNASSYNGFRACRLVVNNYGLATQTINAYYSVAAGPYTDQSSAKLRDLLFNSTFTSCGAAFAWNAASAALPLPNYLYIRESLNQNRLRISAIDCVKIL